MKLSFVNYLSCAAFVASASALRVAFVAPSVNVNVAVEANQPGPVAWLVKPDSADESVPKPHHRGPCNGLRQKASSLSESLRIALGWGTHVEGKHAHKETMAKTPGGDIVRVVQLGPGEPRPHHHHHHHEHEHEGEEGNARIHRHGKFHHGMHGQHQPPSFIMRVHFALMSLGPWEGRAVAFVLGCGIGVLLRMFFVLAVLSFRAIKGSREASADHDFYYDALPADAEEIFVAAPTYTVAAPQYTYAAYPAEKQEIPAPMPIPVPAPVEHQN